MSNLRKLAYDLNELKKSSGYKPKWANAKIEIDVLKVLNTKQRKLLPVVDGNSDKILNYSHLSVLHNQERKMPFVVAYNVHISKDMKTDRGTFRTDDRIPKEIQLNKKFYDLIPGSGKDFEIGHMAAHDEMAWGDEAQLQSYRTFFFPNSCPQVESLNSGLWRGLEQYFISETQEIKNKKAHIFTGPALRQDDPLYVKDKTFRLPQYFYKIVVFEFNNELRSTAFLMSQVKRLKELNLIAPATRSRNIHDPGDKNLMPFTDYSHKDIFQVDVALVEGLTGLKFKWKDVKRIPIPNGANKLDAILKIRTAADLPRTRGGHDSHKASATEDDSKQEFEVRNFIYV